MITEVLEQLLLTVIINKEKYRMGVTWLQQNTTENVLDESTEILERIYLEVEYIVLIGYLIVRQKQVI